MNKRRRFTCLLLVIIIIAFAASVLLKKAAVAEQAGDKMQKPEIKHVFIIIADGLQAKAVGTAQAPNINGLGQAGVTAKEIVASLPDRSRPAVATIFTGLEPSRHGCIDQNDNISAESFPDVLEQKGYKTAFFDGTGGVYLPLVKNCCNVYKDHFNGKDVAVMDTFIAEFEKNSSFFNIIILPQLKETLENFGPDSKDYAGVLAGTDNQVGRLWHYLNRRGISGQSLVVIAGTCITPALIMKGPGLKEGLLLDAAGLADITPTLAALLDFSWPAGSGMILWDAFRPGQGLSEEYLLKNRLSDLTLALYNAKRENSMIGEERIELEKNRYRMASEKNLIMKEIARRDHALEREKFKLKLSKYLFVVLIGSSALICLYQYRYLKKKYLFFD